MSEVIAPKSNDTEMRTLLEDIHDGDIQLPEFQRDWTWDDDRVRGIIASLSQGYPMGAIMQLEYGNESVRFKYRAFEGVENKDVVPNFLVLDGQQRLTALYQAACATEPVNTKTDKGKKITRYYYLDINKCLNDSEDRLEAVISMPEDRKKNKIFSREIDCDLSTRELEYKEEKFPLNIVFDSYAREDWADGYKKYYNYDDKYMNKYYKFREEVIETITGYKMPVITLDKRTPREAVCKVFENVNTGGVSLTVFELVTATFATYEFDLRKDWQECKKIIRGENEPLTTDVMYGVDETAFLTAITLYTTYITPNKATSCKKKDVLSLDYDDYINNRDKLLEGYKLARKFLINQCVYRKRDLPYATQLTPLSAICAVIGEPVFNQPKTQKILSQWFWCGILGEMYGGANETRFANDIDDVVATIKGEGNPNRTINAAFFSSTRLLTLQTRNSAAYKGIMALLYQEGCRDFISGKEMNAAKSMDENPDIHHIFPEDYCRKMNYPQDKWNSIVNKTPLLASTNRSIGGDAPSCYCKKIMDSAEITEDELKARVESNLVDYDSFIVDDFDDYFISRAKAILKIVEKAMGKTIADKDAEQTIQQFGASLSENNNK